MSTSRKKSCAPNKATSLPTFQWAANNHEKIWKLIHAIELPAQMKVIVGKEKGENSSGDLKAKVFWSIGAEVWPKYSETDPTKTSELHGTYQKHATCLRQTGKGVHQDDNDNQESNTISLDFYIPPEGPDHDTPPEAENIWKEIVKDFKFFPHLHHILSTRANITPPAVTTGITPYGRQTILLQQPDNTIPDELIDPVLHNQPPPAPEGQTSPSALLATPVEWTPSAGSLSSASEMATPPPQSMLSASQMAALASISRLPKKRELDELLGDIYQQHVSTSQQQATTAEKVAETDKREKSHNHYRSEKATVIKLLQADVYTVEEAREKIHRLDKKLKVYEKTPTPPSSPVRSTRAASPSWDIEEDN
uniref:Uncharacterized protein n=1 Tax=Moniliophthora roreri TaxID=221103 RepID=A0A0W0FSZ1_MONRR